MDSVYLLVLVSLYQFGCFLVCVCIMALITCGFERFIYQFHTEAQEGDLLFNEEPCCIF